jgi:hypothetical protein
VISSTLLSLVVVPVFYLAIEGVKKRLRGAEKTPEPPTVVKTQELPPASVANE